MQQAALSDTEKMIQSIHIGIDDRGQDHHWNVPDSPNFNAVFLGISGSGKTHTIQQTVARFYALGATFHVMDIKGDMSAEAFEKAGLAQFVPPHAINNIVFNYFEDGAALNPLQVPRSREGGGVVRTIENMKELLKIFSPNAGARQQNLLVDVLKLVYGKKGILQDDESTWSNPPPTLIDVLEELDNMLKHMVSGLTKDHFEMLLESYGAARKKAVKAMRDAEETGEPVLAALDEVRGELSEKVVRIVEQAMTPEAIRERDKDVLFASWDRSVVSSLRSIISSMVDAQLFTGQQSKTRANAINRYDISELGGAHQQIVMRIVAERVFAMGVMETRVKGLYNPTFPRHILVADEGKHVKEISKSPLSPFNRIATEGRGFGLGVWCGIQQPDQVTKDALKNFATYFLLNTPDSSMKEVSSLFGVRPAQLRQLRPRENVLFSNGGGYTLLTHYRN